MHKRFHFNRVLMRYLLSFLIVFLVPTLIFQCTVYPRFASMLNSNVLNTQVQQTCVRAFLPYTSTATRCTAAAISCAM